MGPMKNYDNYHDPSHAYSKVLFGPNIMEPDKINRRLFCHDALAQKLMRLR